ncbi:hypothetical protein [Cribrihabitans neustonicus]|uniref:hypothetical protein n=1 Tax=Cribrihabitans neustonicus TaxID=1429085 RepID=UPI003B5A56E3
MFLELIAVIFAGLAAAGLVMMGGRAFRGRLPRWLAPVAAAVSMIGVTIALEYGWYGRTRAALPEGLTVAETVEHESIYRPWTYAVPYVDRFAALDTAGLMSHPAHPDIFLAEIFFFGRWAPVSRASALLDCGGWRRALVEDGAEIGTDALPEGLAWVAAEPEDAILTTACDGRA